ncbi:hypothetical protein SAICODRAFT_16675 [Saitoella complicata NRRL Y-17804]|uniref:Translation initiation factor 3 N-terminal domain-containing protein n=1 Tax=Saitoella complicata (strain BCRC 22490 / CBS 7301 / JCM 7358 / NBRC 10748 / NRRL Y-17804) TaxID=698492 RepID=A0A0E9N8K6_SAICN|nr:uncharacterized protein SAICODRAFT_16675 [Saitoella complicata NRRL Y-17804]ODQ55616.1 hypothetical protein SAICODRAFT_16675 [Saitoella complicata NRRL Y-17804]GAO46031.1 hypothetical protein G7K_0276-t1 [Saitoella complicata NRRL Y-17804]
MFTIRRILTPAIRSPLGSAGSLRGIISLHQVQKVAREETALKANTLRDANIRAKFINFVDPNGEFKAKRPLSEILGTYDTTQYTLFNLTPLADVPTCKLITHAEFEAKNTELKKEKKKKESFKEATVTWWAKPADVMRYVKKAQQWLQDGSTVEFRITSKRRSGGRQPHPPADQKNEYLKMVRDGLSEAGEEWRPYAGTITAVDLVCFFKPKSGPQLEASAEGEAAQSSADGESATLATTTQQPAAKEVESKGSKPEKTAYQFRKEKRAAEEAERRAAEEEKLRIEREQMQMQRRNNSFGWGSGIGGNLGGGGWSGGNGGYGRGGTRGGGVRGGSGGGDSGGGKWPSW